MRSMTALVAGLVLAVAISGCSRPTGVAAAATSVDVPSKILRRLMDFASLSRDNGSARPFSFASIRLSVLMWVFKVLAYS